MPFSVTQTTEDLSPNEILNEKMIQGGISEPEFDTAVKSLQFGDFDMLAFIAQDNVRIGKANTPEMLPTYYLEKEDEFEYTLVLSTPIENTGLTLTCNLTDSSLWGSDVFGVSIWSDDATNYPSAEGLQAVISQNNPINGITGESMLLRVSMSD